MPRGRLRMTLVAAVLVLSSRFPLGQERILIRVHGASPGAPMKPIFEIGFMPEALSVEPTPYRHHWSPGDDYNAIYTGWAHPPRDYGKWRDLVSAWVRHSVERYGQREVESWWWDVWNEPDGGYW